jgi:AraC-like DNA-binding protein
MDVLADALGSFRLTAGVFVTARMTPPWSVISPPSVDVARVTTPPPGPVSGFHVIVEGRCFVRAGGVTIAAQAGDCVVISAGESHVLCSDTTLTPEPMAPYFAPSARDGIPHVEHGEGKDAAALVCGFLRGDARLGPLVRSLPPILCVRGARHVELVWPEPSGLVTRCPAGDDAGGWLAAVRRRTVEEASAGRRGSSVMVTRLVEILFVEVLRRYIEAQPAGGAAWISAARDDVVARALGRLHEAPGRSWTVEGLAREVGASRSVLAARFRARVGCAPMEYLTRHRIYLAKRLLATGDLSLAAVAERAGYASAEAFSRAFHRAAGLAPGAWRRLPPDARRSAEREGGKPQGV